MPSKEIKFNIPLPSLSGIGSFLGKINITHILLFSAIIRVFVMPFPQDGGLVFDEAHYTKAVNGILSGVHANPEHPPLTKLIVAASVKVFGNYWFAWRLPMVLFSLVSTYLVYLIAKEFFSEQIALMASGFLIFDLIWFIHGNIFMLEPPCMTFGLLFILLYLRGKVNWSAVSLSLAGLANEKALFFLFGIGVYHGLTHWVKPKREDFKKLGGFLLILAVVGGGSLWVFDSVLPPSKATSVTVMLSETITEDQNGVAIRTETATSTATDYVYMNDPVSHVLWMGQYYSGINANLETTLEEFRPPWNWVTPFADNLDFKVFNSAKYLVTVVRAGDKEDFIINFRAQTPIFIWYMTIPIIILSLYRLIKEKEVIDDEVFKSKDDKNESRFMLAWITGTYVPWVVKDLFQMNMTFNHYFQFTIPIICIGIPWFWSQVAPGRWERITVVHLVCVVLFFFLFFPIGLVRTIT